MDIDDGREQRTEAIAKDWDVSAQLLDDVFWDLHPRNGNDGAVYGYYVEFDSETERARLDELGVRAGEFSRTVSLNAFDEPEPEDPDEHVAYLARQYKQLGGANGAIRTGDVVLLNPWSPSAPAAQEFWDRNIGVLPVKDRRSFLIELSRYGW